MAVEITMPQLSDTMDQGTILTWLKKEGDQVSRGDELAEVGTDKADLPIESFYEGTLLKIYAAEGSTVKVGELIAVVGEQGESLPAATPVSSSPAVPLNTESKIEIKEVVQATSPAPVQPVPVVSKTKTSDRLKVSPLARKMAESKGVDLASISGSGEGGRIVKRDIEAAETSSSFQPAKGGAVAAKPSVISQSSANLAASTQPLSRMRQAIATRMVEATTTIPHFYLTSAVSADGMVKMRKSLKTLPQYEGLTFNHLIIKAVALSLRRFPRINSHYDNAAIVQPGSVNIGIITAVEDGLLIPVLKGADVLHLADLLSESRGLVSRARSGRPKADDLSGATFCISNVGALPIESFTAVISPGNGGILAVGAIQDEVVAVEGEPRIQKTMRVTLSVDHRIIDGVMGAEFLAGFKEFIEDPVLLLA